jgi:hypothetical protein
MSETKVRRFQEMIGETLLGVILPLHPTQMVSFKLRAVEAGGLWIESQIVIEGLLRKLGEQASEKTPLLFVPFSQIKYIAAFHDVPALSERGFGV